MTNILEARNVTKQFGGLVAVSQVDFAIPEGSIVSLIGPNGAGKTTFFNVIAGLYKPTSGTVRFRDRIISGLPPHRITRFGISRTFQNIRLFANMSALENVMVGRHSRMRSTPFDAVLRLPWERREERETATLARELLEYVGLKGRDDVTAKNLPYGDQRRLEMARALATQPKILLLDEVMAGLNPSEIDQAVALVGKLSARGLTIVIVEHVMRAIMAVARHIVVLDHGQKIAEGAPKEIVENPEVIRAYLGSYVHPPAAGGA
jgi:branched-chain amino acid transport system ATP-binding protein